MLTQPLTRPLTRKIHRAQLTSIRYRDFDPLSLEPYLLFDAESSMLGNLENPTLDLDASDNGSLDVITATRAGIATFTAADGQIVTADENTVRVDWSLGYPAMLIEPSATNLLPYSEDFTQSSWLKNDVSVSSAPVAAPDGTMTAAHVSVTGSNAHLVDVNVVPAGTHTVSIWARTVSGSGTCYFHWSGSSTSSTLQTITDQWQRFEVPANNDHVYAVDFRGAATLDEVYIWGAQLEAGSVATSYIPTSGGSVAERTRNADNLQVERDSTNLVSYSSPTLAQAVATNLTGDSGTYYGLSNWLEFGPASSGLAYVEFPEVGLITGTHTLSFYIIMDDGGVPVVGNSGSGSGSDFSVLLEGVSNAGQSGVVTHVTGDMYRVSGVRTCTGSSTGHQIRKYANQSERGFKITGIQLESGELTSLIPTSGTTESRTNFSDFYNATEGTVYVEYEPRVVSSSNCLFQFSDGTSSHRILSLIDNYYNLYVSISSTVYTFGNSGSPQHNTLNRLGASFKAGNGIVSLNGGTEATNTSLTMPTITQLNLGTRDDGTSSMNGYIRRILYWPTHSSSL